METLKSLDVVASQLLQKLPEIIKNGTLYGNDLFDRFIQYSIVVNSIGIGITSLLLPLSVYMIYAGFKKYDNDNWQQPLYVIPGTIIFLFSLIIFVDTLRSLIQVIYLPELYLIEYFK